MKVKGYGVNLRSMQQADIEMVRQWRNSPVLLPFMHNRRIISAQQQNEWFNSIDNLHNHYFIVEYENEDIGFCSLKNIEFDTLKVEPGLFVATQEYLGSPVGVAILITLMELGYIRWGLSFYYGHVLASNSRAISNYQAIGAEVEPGQSPESVTLVFRDYSPDKPKIDRAKQMLIQYFNCAPELVITQ